MSVQVWWIWMVLAALFIIGEIFTAGLFLLWFGLGAAVAGILALVGLNPGWQWGTFVVVSTVLFAATRRFAERLTKKQPAGVGADRFIGRSGVVLQEVDNIKNTGLVRVEKDEWRAESDTGEVILTGALVKVTRLDGTHLVVKVLKEGE